MPHKSFPNSKSARVLLTREQNHDDPFSAVTRPPLGETDVQREARLAQQLEAHRVSKEIDAQLHEDRKGFEQRQRAVKLLLLGQAEAGKSTLLKNFQLVFSPNHFRNERMLWCTIIQLNLIGCIKRILEVLTYDSERSTVAPSSRSGSGRPASAPFDKHRRIRMQLSPLLAIETSLSQKMDPESYARSFALQPFERGAGDRDFGAEGPRELSVRAGSGWKIILQKATVEPPRLNSTKSGRPGSAGGRSGRPGTSEGRGREDPTTVLAACKDDIVSLWNDSSVQETLRKHDIRLEESPGFFMNDAARIATPGYEPSNADIVRARIRTLGVEEHRFKQEGGLNANAEWVITDVGGSRSMRTNWLPFFDTVQAVIFLAPLAFNQVLDEDQMVNRLEDSVCLWRGITASPLLSHATLILFLNKMDILKATLLAGVEVRKYVPSYGDAPNDVEHVTRYFKEKFRAYHKKLSPKPRPWICHETSAIDTQSTAALLVDVRESILRTHLERMNIM